MNVCVWKYHKGMIEGTHFAESSCSHRMKCLSKIKGSAPVLGCADVYNWRQCPECGKPIEIDYSSLGKQDIIL